MAGRLDRLFQQRRGIGRVGANRYHRPDQSLQVSVGAAGGDSLTAGRVGERRRHGHLGPLGCVGGQAADDLLGLDGVGASRRQGYLPQGPEPGRRAADGAGVLLGLRQQLPGVVRADLGPCRLYAGQSHALQITRADGASPLFSLCQQLPGLSRVSLGYCRLCTGRRRVPQGALTGDGAGEPLGVIRQPYRTVRVGSGHDDGDLGQCPDLPVDGPVRVVQHRGRRSRLPLPRTLVGSLPGPTGDGEGDLPGPGGVGAGRDHGDLG